MWLIIPWIPLLAAERVLPYLPALLCWWYGGFRKPVKIPWLFPELGTRRAALQGQLRSSPAQDGRGFPGLPEKYCSGSGSRGVGVTGVQESPAAAGRAERSPKLPDSRWQLSLVSRCPLSPLQQRRSLVPSTHVKKVLDNLLCALPTEKPFHRTHALMGCQCTKTYPYKRHHPLPGDVR